jgi:ornithine carbamoyltransferase
MTRHILDIDDLAPAEITSVLDLAELADPPQLLAGKGVALIFEKPSARTRNSMEVAVHQLGGQPVSLRDEEMAIDRRESAEDVARTLSCYHGVIGARVYDHRVLERMAAVATVPLVNLLSDRAHPCQALADLLTVRQHFGSLEGRTLAYVGDYNNMATSLAAACVQTGMHMRVACPNGYGPSEGSPVAAFDDPATAVKDADVVYTDVWTSMGQEEEAAARRAAFAGFTVDPAMMSGAAQHAIFLHCLPAHRGEEVAAEVVDGPRSLVWKQAENRLHAQRGLLLFLLSQ